MGPNTKGKPVPTLSSWPPMPQNMNPQAQARNLSAGLRIRNWPPPKGVDGPLIGWDKDHNPFIVYKRFDTTSPTNQNWFAVGVEPEAENERKNQPAGYRPVAKRLAEGADTEHFIERWAFSPDGPDPEKFEREMLEKEREARLEEMRRLYGSAVGEVAQGPPNEPRAWTAEKVAREAHKATSLWKRMVDAINKKT
jgi:hypothetical protein